MPPYIMLIVNRASYCCRSAMALGGIENMKEIILLSLQQIILILAVLAFLQDASRALRVVVLAPG